MLGIDSHPLYMMRNHFLQSLNKTNEKKSRKRSIGDQSQQSSQEDHANKIRKTQDAPTMSSPQDASKNQVLFATFIIQKALQSMQVQVRNYIPKSGLTNIRNCTRLHY